MRWTRQRRLKVSYEIESALALSDFEDDPGKNGQTTGRHAVIDGTFKVREIKQKKAKKAKPEPKKEYFLEPGWYERSDMPIDSSNSYVLHVTDVQDGRSLARWFQLSSREYSQMNEFQLNIDPDSYNVEQGYTFRKLEVEDKKMFRYKTPV